MKRPLVVEEERLNFDTPVKKLGANSMKCNVDVVRIRENSIQLNGWAIGKTPETESTIRLKMGHISRSGFSMWRPAATTSAQIYFGRTVEKELGFDIQFPYERGKDYYLIAKTRDAKSALNIMKN